MAACRYCGGDPTTLRRERRRDIRCIYLRRESAEAEEKRQVTHHSPGEPLLQPVLPPPPPDGRAGAKGQTQKRSRQTSFKHQPEQRWKGSWGVHATLHLKSLGRRGKGVIPPTRFRSQRVARLMQSPVTASAVNTDDAPDAFTRTESQLHQRASKRRRLNGAATESKACKGPERQRR